ncbi:MAG: cytochrome P450 [Clostridia bacterium]|nr:cytochrome P450 [Clostridia bacterium]
MHIWEQVESVIEELCYSDLIESARPENYEKLKEEAADLLDEAYEILKKMKF